jgi:hypothetical protein
MAAAIGHACNIPSILRNLASYFYRHASSNLPVSFNLASLLDLDAGCDSDDIARPVASYHLDWWTQETSELLSFDTLDPCLQHFQRLTGLSEIIPPGFKKPSYTWSRHLSMPSNGVLPACHNCTMYRAVALGALDDLRDLRHLAHGLEVRADRQVRSAKRDAGAFFQLYEAALLKGIQEEDVLHASESNPILTPSDAVLMPSMRPSYADVSSPEAISMPPRFHMSASNPKWTSGPSLTRSEVLDVFRPPPGVRPPAHSGYNTSLSPGPRHDDSSIALSPGMPLNIFDSPDVIGDRVPSLHPDDFPIHFNFPPLRNFPEDAPLLTAGISAFAVLGPPHPPFPPANKLDLLEVEPDGMDAYSSDDDTDFAEDAHKPDRIEVAEPDGMDAYSSEDDADVAEDADKQDKIEVADPDGMDAYSSEDDADVAEDTPEKVEVAEADGMDAYSSEDDADVAEDTPEKVEVAEPDGMDAYSSEDDADVAEDAATPDKVEVAEADGMDAYSSEDDADLDEDAVHPDQAVGTVFRQTGPQISMSRPLHPLVPSQPEPDGMAAYSSGSEADPIDAYSDDDIPSQAEPDGMVPYSSDSGSEADPIDGYSTYGDRSHGEYLTS